MSRTHRLKNAALWGKENTPPPCPGGTPAGGGQQSRLDCEKQTFLVEGGNRLGLSSWRYANTSLGPLGEPMGPKCAVSVRLSLRDVGRSESLLLLLLLWAPRDGGGRE